MKNNDEIKTKFKGPGQWKNQAQRLEKDAPKPDREDSDES